MTDLTTQANHTHANHTHDTGSHRGLDNAGRRASTETKASFKTSELVAYVVVALGVLIASAIVDVRDFGAQEAWLYVTALTIGYMISRGLAKSGSREHFDDETDHNTGR